METEAGKIARVGKGETAPEGRETWRNGYRRRERDTRVGTVQLNFPSLREGSYMPNIIEPRPISIIARR